MTGLYPYGRYALSPRLGIWASAKMTMAAAGTDGLLLDGGAAGLSLSTIVDVTTVKTTTDAVDGLAGSEGNVSRFRLGLEAVRPFPLSNGASLLPSLSVGVRQDSGDAETGFGTELGGGLSWMDPQRGISADLKGRILLTHGAEDFQERGMAVSFAWDPHPSDRGPSLSVSHALGAAATGGLDALLNPTTMEGLGADPDSRILLTHGAEDFQERGMAVSFAWDPHPSDRGPSLSVSHALGAAATGGLDALLNPTTMEGLGADPDSRILLTHGAEDFQERGMAVSFAWDPHPSDRGPSLSVSHALGAAATGGLDALLNPTTMEGLGADPDSRILLTHGAEDFQERGMAVSFAWDPHPSDRGPSLSVSHALGAAATGGLDALLNPTTMEGLGADPDSRILLTHGAEDFQERGMAVSFAWDPHPSDRGPSLSVSHALGAAATGGLDALLNPTTMEGLGADPDSRILLTHGAEDFQERGMAVSFAWDPHPSDRGPSLSVSHALGAAATGGLDALLNPTTIEGMGADDGSSEHQQFATRLAYGFPAFGDRLTVTPSLGLAFSPYSSSTSLRWALTPYAETGQMDEPWTISLEGQRQEDRTATAPVDYSFKLRFSLQL